MKKKSRIWKAGKQEGAPAVVRRWKKWMAVGCSHGFLIDRQAGRIAYNFRSDYKPDLTIHLGDFWDATALRSGAPGTKDSAVSIDHDLRCGLTFIEQLEANWIFFGNHDDRVERFQNHPDALKSYAARKITQDLDALRKRLNAEVIPYDIENGWRSVGNHLFGHGYMYNEMAIRDHAELVGNCVFVHLHRTGEERGRRRGGATGYCLGLLGDIHQLQYARSNKATLKWNNAFGYGEYCDDSTTVHMVKRADNGQWRLP